MSTTETSVRYNTQSMLWVLNNIWDKDIKLKRRNELNELKPRCTEGEMGDLAYHMLEDICGKTASTGAEQPTSAG